MKVTTCLNPLPTALSLFGRLLGFDRVMDAVKDPDIRRLIEQIGYREGLPVVKDPGSSGRKTSLTRVLNARFPNSYIPDTTARIVSDTSIEGGHPLWRNHQGVCP
jgi:fructuronate reductase